MVKSAFAKRPGEDADLEDAGSGEYYALKVEKMDPAAVPKLADARPAARPQPICSPTFMDALRAKANALVDQLKAGKPHRRGRRDVSALVRRRSPGLRRIEAAKYQAMGQSFLQNVFGVKPGEPPSPRGSAERRSTSRRSIRLVRETPTPAPISTMRIRGRIGEAYASDLLAAVKAEAQREEKAQINLNLARQAIGVDPAAVGAQGWRTGQEMIEPAAGGIRGGLRARGSPPRLHPSDRRP